MSTFYHHLDKLAHLPNNYESLNKAADISFDNKITEVILL